MVLALTDAVMRDNASKNLRSIVISAKGPVFSAGHNLKELHVIICLINLLYTL